MPDGNSIFGFQFSVFGKIQLDIDKAGLAFENVAAGRSLRQKAGAYARPATHFDDAQG
jgi:hypothetical protein